MSLKPLLIAQIVLSLIVIIFGASYAIRAFVNGQIFCAALFALLAYLAGYRLLLKTSVAEFKELN